MDDFPGILARDFGFRPQGKSAPMSASKSSGVGSGSSRSATAHIPAFDDVFGGPPRYPNQSYTRSSSQSTPQSSFGSMFDGMPDPNPNPGPAGSMPIYDKPVYDDDIFNGIPGIKSSGTVKYDDVFGSMSSPPKKGHGDSPQPYDDDLLASLGKSSGESGRKEEDFGGGFDDLLPGFGGSSPRKTNKRY